MQRFTDPQHVEVGVGVPFVVELTGNGVGGYLWRVGAVPASVALHDERDVAPSEVVPGAGGSKEFELEATEPGEAVVRFLLKRDWEDAPAREQVVRVTAG